MVEANTSSTQQSADAQHVDNMTSMQQSSPEAPSGARSDAPVQTNNVGAQDGPSQLNASPNGNSNANNVQGGITTNSNINGGSAGTNGSGVGGNAGSPIGQGVIGAGAGANGAGLGGLGSFGANAAINDGGGATVGNGGTGGGATGGNAAGGGNAGAGGAGRAGGAVAGAGGATAAGNAGAGGAVATTGGGTTATTAAPTTASPTTGATTAPVVAPVTAPTEVAQTTPTTTLNNVTLTGAAPLLPVEANTTNTSSGAPSVALNPVLDAPVSAAITELGATTNAPANIISSVAPVAGVPTGDVVHFSYFDASTSNAQSIAITLNSVKASGTSFDAANLATLTTALTPDPTGKGVVTQVFSLDKVTPSIVTTAAGLTGTQTAVDLKFIVPDKTFDPLAAGQTVTATYDVVVTNSVTGLASSIQQVTITITGSNDIPVIGAATTNLGLGLYDAHIADNYTNPYPDLAGNGHFTHANFLADGVISIADPDLGESSFQSGTSGGAGAVVAAAGNIGALVLAEDGSYIYRIDQLPTNALGQFDPAGSISDNWVLTDFQTLFVPGTTHTDTFTITSFDGTTKDVHFTINGDHNIEGSVVEPDPTTPAIKTGSLNFAAGTHDAMVLVGNDSNAYYSGIGHLNIGSLSIDNTGAFIYTVTADQIKTYEGGLPDSFNTGRDTFIVESTNGVNINYQEVSFNIFRADHLATATGVDQTLTEASIAGDNVFLFPTWDSVYDAASGHNYAHTINNFNVKNGDRIDLSAILTSSSDILSDHISIDGAGGTSSSTLSVHHGGSDYQVASITGVEATVNDLMWGFNSGADPATSLNAATTWTDVIDISNISLGNPTITAHSGASVDKTAYTAGAGGWTIDIVSGNATVSADKDGTQHINFTSPNSQNEVIITDPSNKVHDLSNINQINWHAT